MKELTPIREKASDYEEIEKEILRIFKEEIYLPLLRDMPGFSRRIIRNSLSSLAEAIRSGEIDFNRGRFTGSFNAGISRELRKLGAKWDRSARGYRIHWKELPQEIQFAVSASITRFDTVLAKIDSRLAIANPAEIAGKVKLSEMFNKRLWKTDAELKKSMKAIGVIPELTKSRAAVISKDYSTNMDLYIKDWTEKAIKELRQKMRGHSFSGLRYDGMIKEIQRSYDVSKGKARFLARQETSLLMTSFKYERYQEAGIDQYKWRCVVGTTRHPVRPMHKKLDGKIFSFDNPPVTSPNGDRNNPGRDYNCRCVAVPITNI